MKTTISSETDLKDYNGKFSEDVVMIHFKMVGIGSNTLARAEYSGANICQITQEQPGYFLISEDGTGLREAMHDLVDRFCNAQEGK